MPATDPDLGRFVSRLVKTYDISHLAAGTIIDAYLDLVIEHEPELWDEGQRAFTDEGRADILARLNTLTDPATRAILHAEHPILRALNHAGIQAREYLNARDELIVLAMTTKTARADIAEAVNLTVGRLDQIRTARAQVRLNASEQKIAGPAYRDRWNKPELRILAADSPEDPAAVC